MFLLRRHSSILAVLFLFIVLSPGGSVCIIAQMSSSQPAKTVTSATAERALRVQWRRLFDNRSWTELDALANRLRTERLRFQGGGWQLHVLYTILSTTSTREETDAAWEAQIAALEEWIRQSPSSPTPRVALADTYENFAWKARGGDFADTVTPEGWKLFGERMQKALDTLNEAEQIRQMRWLTSR